MVPRTTKNNPILTTAAKGFINFSFSFLTMLIMLNTTPSIMLTNRIKVVTPRKAGLFDLIRNNAVIFAIKIRKIRRVAIEKPTAILEKTADFPCSDNWESVKISVIF